MKLSNFREAPLMRAYFLINQEKSKRGFKSLQQEINKMTESYGPSFDKNLYKILFDEIEFNDLKSFQNQKTGKIQFFLQEFPQLLEREDFINFFSEILMFSENKSSALEIFNSLNKVCKLSLENQFKILISMIMSTNKKYEKEAQKIIIEKYKEIKDDNGIKLSENIIQTLIMVLEIFDEEYKNEAEDFINFLEINDNSDSQNQDDIKQIQELEKILETGNEEPIEIEKIFFEIGPYILNNNIEIKEDDMLNFDIDEKRLGSFIIFLLKHQNWVENKENKLLNKIFLKSLNNKANNLIDDVSDKKNINWNIDNLYKMFKKNIDSMNPDLVFKSFDDPIFSIKDKKNFEFFISTLQKLKILNNPSQFFKFIFSKWENENNQIDFLSFLINNSIQGNYSFKNYNGLKVKKNIELNSLISNQKSSFLIEAWICIDLIRTLISLSTGNYYIKVKEIFEWPIHNIPEILINALIQIEQKKDEFLYEELFKELLHPLIMNQNNNNQNLLEEIWNKNRDLIIKSIYNIWINQPNSIILNKILDNSLKIKDSLSYFLNSKYYDFSINLAFLASKKELINLDQWIKERIRKGGEFFLESFLHHLQINLIEKGKDNTIKKEVIEKANLSLESLAIILENLLVDIPSIKNSRKLLDEKKNISKAILEVFGDAHYSSINSEEIQQATNALYHQMFNKEITVEELINKLLQYKHSKIQKEIDVLYCMTHSTLDEYRFFHQYPEEKLKLMAELFGQMVKNNFFTGILERIALKYIIEGIKKGTGLLYIFGIIALNQIIDKTKIWPKFIRDLLELEVLKENNKDIYEKLEKKANELNGTNEKNNNSNNENNSFVNLKKNLKPQTTSLKLQCEINDNNILGNGNMIENIPSPSQEIIDKIKSILNSITKSNLTEKAKEIKTIINSEKIERWFSNFFVNKLSGENNNYQIYNDLITSIDSFELNKYMTKDTIFYIRKLLNSENLDKSIKEQNVLKNLGSWLGIITLSKNRPILAKDLDMKELIIDAYENGKLNIIIIFISKILEHSAKTKVFHPKNPWIQAILSLLAEISIKPNLKNKIKIEIDNLFQKLEFDMISPTSKLLDNKKVCQNSADFSKPQNICLTIQDFLSKISNLDDYIKSILNIINTDNNNNVKITKQELCAILTQVLNHSINEIISVVSERSLKISLITTKQILIKDFMFDNDQIKFKNASESFIKTLSGSLAMILSKEPLRIGLSRNMKRILQNKKISQESIEKIVNLSDDKYYDIGTRFIYNYVIKNAIDKLENDEEIRKEIERRKLNQIPFQKQQELLSKMEVLPDELKPNMDGLTESQYKIYANFDKIHEDYNKFEDNVDFLNIVYNMLKEAIGQQSDTYMTKNYSVCMFNIYNLSQEPKNKVGEEFSNLTKIIEESKIEDVNFAFDLANVTLKYCFSVAKNSNEFLLNIYSFILKGWVNLHKEISNKITESVLSIEEIFVKFNIDLHYAFIKNKIFNMEDYQKYFKEFLQNKSTLDISRKVLKELFERGVIEKKTLPEIPSYIYGEYSDIYYKLFSINSKLNNLTLKINSSPIKFKNFKENNTYLICYFAFNRIPQLVNSNNNLEKNQKEEKEDNVLHKYIYNENNYQTLSAILTEICIKGTFDNNKVPMNRSTPENVSNFFFDLLSYIDNSKLNHLKLFNIIITGIFNFFHQDYITSKTSFNQRLYYKLFYNMIHHLNKFGNKENLFKGEYKKINYLTILSDFLLIISPTNYSGFALAWLDLISCKDFISNFLDYDKTLRRKEVMLRYEKYLSLLIDLLSYLKSFANEEITNYNFKIFLDQVYKFFFLLCNSYPDYISSYYYLILIPLPSGNYFIQLKNIILSSCPKDIYLPDPLNEDSKDIVSRKSANVLFDVNRIVEKLNFKELTDNYIEKKDEKYLKEIVDEFNSIPKESEQRSFNINALVLYWALSKIKSIIERKIGSKEVFNFFIYLFTNLDNENRDHLINAFLNELRFNSQQTSYFSSLLIYIFGEIKDTYIKEHILKNILERFLYKPYPWGLISTFILLTKNPKFQSMNKYISKDILDKFISCCKDKSLNNFYLK